MDETHPYYFGCQTQVWHDFTEEIYGFETFMLDVLICYSERNPLFLNFLEDVKYYERHFEKQL